VPPSFRGEDFLSFSQSEKKLPMAIMFFRSIQFLKIFSSEIAWPNKAKFYREHLWEVLLKMSSFQIERKNMIAMGNFFSDWLKLKKSSPLKVGGTMNIYFV
jgi:hypothetical protein